ncbi:putative ABC transport system permease protein/macrolide transport system ATP-binding/permease protein [Granulicella rosea]|uniref:Putative ABC transport system permease protein/macrolide transport system ATP-binding/permease protein n=1 Tax=Granulicella rosea TaxID=474952 RepID=A0A239LDR1_9BACT|nr:ABC transporter permease [Granulicella rosea]SNT28082.1 putative ABC transport system permease protein/macrolide transport system ATP-binding/permease protein [Granulicella rosea]
MSVRTSYAIALTALRRNTLQTGLTVLGMTIGVGTVLAMVAVGSGAQRSIAGQVKAAGMNVIVVTAGNYKAAQQWTSIGEAPEAPAAWNPTDRKALQDGVLRSGDTRPTLRRMQELEPDGTPKIHFGDPTRQLEAGPNNLQGKGGAKTLTLEDAAAIAALAGVQTVSAGVHDNGRIGFGADSWVSAVRGEQATLPEIRRAWVLSHGKFFTAADDAQAAPVVVLGSIASEHLFGKTNPVGKTVNVKGLDARVVGVVASGSWMTPAAPGDGVFDAVYLPVHTAMKLLAKPTLDNITVSTASTGDVTRLIKVITGVLRMRHRLDASSPLDFTIAGQAHAAMGKGGLRTDFSRAMVSNTAGLDRVTLAQLSKTLDRASRTMTMLLGSIAAVSLVVGGIGIMNIMLLSVTERTREIGIRRSVGAQAGEVMQQFLMEAVILSIGGGLLGIALGAGASVMVGHLVRWTTELSWASVAASFTISAAIGILFGYYPARQASRVTPIAAMRHE